MELVIKETLEKLLEVLGISFNGVSVKQENEKVFYAEIDTANTSLLIGWHGETLAALQHTLKVLLFNQGVDSTKQVIIDVDGYKRRQEESVIRMAEKKAEYAISTQKEVKLPPMSAYFRRKIHLHLTSDPKFKDAVTTESEGEGDQRCVKILPL